MWWVEAMMSTNQVAAIRMGMAIWFVNGLPDKGRGKGHGKANRPYGIRVNATARRAAGIAGSAASRGLNALEYAGLVEVIDRRKGCYPVVRITECETRRLELHQQQVALEAAKPKKKKQRSKGDQVVEVTATTATTNGQPTITTTDDFSQYNLDDTPPAF